MRFTLVALSVVIISASFSAQAKMYKWVDEEGQMHFGDKIPTKYLVKEHDELNEQGVVVRHKEAAETAEQKAELKRQEIERKKDALITKKKKRNDRVLLDTYTTERDLFVARDSRLDAVGSQIRLATSIIADSNNKIENMEKQVASIKASNRGVPADLYQRINDEKRQVKVQTKVMQAHKVRKDKISEQFGAYIERFKVLKEEQKAKRERIAQKRGL